MVTFDDDFFEPEVLGPDEMDFFDSGTREASISAFLDNGSDILDLEIFEDLDVCRSFLSPEELREQPANIDSKTKGYVAFLDGAEDKDSFNKRKIDDLDAVIEKLSHCCTLKDISLNLFDAYGGYILFSDFDYIITHIAKQNNIGVEKHTSLINEISRHYAAVKTAGLYKNMGFEIGNWGGLRELYNSVSVSIKSNIHQSLRHREIRHASLNFLESPIEYWHGEYKIISMLLEMPIVHISVLYNATHEKIKEIIDTGFSRNKLPSPLKALTAKRKQEKSIEEILSPFEEEHPFYDLSLKRFLENHPPHIVGRKNLILSYNIWKKSILGYTIKEIAHDLDTEEKKVSAIKRKAGINTTKRHAIPFCEVDYTSESFRQYAEEIGIEYDTNSRLFCAAFYIIEKEREGYSKEDIADKLGITTHFLDNILLEKSRYVDRNSLNRNIKDISTAKTITAREHPYFRITPDYFAKRFRLTDMDSPQEIYEVWADAVLGYTKDEIQKRQSLTKEKLEQICTLHKVHINNRNGLSFYEVPFESSEFKRFNRETNYGIDTQPRLYRTAFRLWQEQEKGYSDLTITNKLSIDISTIELIRKRTCIQNPRNHLVHVSNVPDTHKNEAPKRYGSAPVEISGDVHCSIMMDRNILSEVMGIAHERIEIFMQKQNATLFYHPDSDSYLYSRGALSPLLKNFISGRDLKKIENEIDMLMEKKYRT
jgi:hypothetical protein